MTLARTQTDANPGETGYLADEPGPVLDAVLANAAGALAARSAGAFEDAFAAWTRRAPQ